MNFSLSMRSFAATRAMRPLMFTAALALAASCTMTTDENTAPPIEVTPAETLAFVPSTGLKAQTPGQVDLYAVLGGGHPEQWIFQRETAKLQDILENKYDAKGRTIRLGTHVSQPSRRPLITYQSLTESFERIAKTMDPSEDVMLVFLTSHGRPDVISTGMPGQDTSHLTAPAFAAALDNAGVKNAVIVVSACFSGSFIDDLKSPNRLIITAAAEDRSSFGCNDKNEFTYWGDAFFNHGLSKHTDFHKAALTTRKQVTKLEKEAHLTPSQPQISYGTAIRPTLKRLNERLKVQ